MSRAELFNFNTKAIFWNLNPKAIQRMLDYDYLIGRSPSVVAVVAPTSSVRFHKFFFGQEEMLIPIYRELHQACQEHPDADVLVNFASFRTAYPVTLQALQQPSIRTIVIAAEGIPERFTREMVHLARRSGKVILGPATVGGIAAGAFRIANAGGTVENIISSKLYRPGSVGLVTRSGGLFNELSSIISRTADGIVEGIAIGGDRYPGSDFLDHLLRFEADPRVKFMVMLGEVGGELEYRVVEALKRGLIKKPLIAWCIGTVARFLKGEVQFGHAGAKASTERERADVKNQALREAGAIVPESFDGLYEKIREVYQALLEEGKIDPKPSLPPARQVPMDYPEAYKKGLVRRPSSFICTISDERGDEVSYCGVRLSQIIQEGYSLADVIGLLWFKRKFPRWASGFIDLVLKVVADHGPAVSGAVACRIAARAGKDLVSSLASGLLTIGPRFGGAIDGAARYFMLGYQKGMDPWDFVEYMKNVEKIPIPGIGHRIKSVKNPDKRVEIIKGYARKNFPSTPLLDYALEVEKVTTSKKDNLILNVDGAIGVCFVDLFKGLGFSDEELDEIIESGALNAFFILGRTIGFIGHILDEKRLKLPLYRHSWDDIFYVSSQPE